MREAWSELRRRRVVSTAAAYLAVAFVGLQLGEILFPAFDLGPGAVRVLFAVFLALFPIVLALSWVYDVTSAGITRTDEAVGGGPHPVIAAAVVMSALALGGAGFWMVRTVDPARALSASPSSIAVLPFADMSVEGDHAYLGDGVAEEILNILAGVDGLLVAARTSSFAFREDDDIREIGSSLDVGHVLEGSVRRSDDEVRVTAQLIDARTGFHLWSETYDRPMDDLFAVQDEIAGAIAEALLGTLDVPDLDTSRSAVSTEAQELYWRGRAQWSRRDVVGIPGAIELFNRAIAVDSTFAEAYAGLADSWALMPQLVPSVDPAETMERAERYASRAIELDQGLAEAHASLGLVRALRRDRVGALAALGRAIELNGSYAPALHWRGNVLAEMGRLGDALSDARRAATLDPLSPSIASDLGYILLWTGDVEEAEREFQRAQSLEFGFRPSLFGSALVALEEGREVELRMALTQWVAMSGLPAPLASELSRALLRRRETGAPQPLPPALVTSAERGSLPAGTAAALLVLLGAEEEGLQWLGRSVEDGTWVDQYLRVNPVYDDLRHLARFREILDEVGG